MQAIETKNLTKFYGKSRGITDVDLSVNEGEIFGFIGPNGAGKSTTIRTLLGFIHPTGGTAEIFGKNCFRETREIKKDIGYLPSEVNYYDDMRIKDLLGYSQRFYNGNFEKRTKELCDVFEVDVNKKIDSLSLGNRKKVAIIQSLLHGPKLLILDEPTSGLDPLMQNRFFEVLLEENKKGTTIFFSSHFLSEVQKLCHRVAIIKEGKILKVEEVEKLRSQTFRKVKIEFASPDSKMNLKGVANLQSKGKLTEFLYNDKIDSLVKELAKDEIENLWIEEPSLEEIFMHYYEGDGKKI